MFDTNVYDTHAGHSTSSQNTKYFPQVAGIHLCIGQVAFIANATGVRVAQIAKNRSATPGQMQANNSGGSNATVLTANSTVALEVGDYVEVEGVQASGGSLSTIASASTFQVIFKHA